MTTVRTTQPAPDAGPVEIAGPGSLIEALRCQRTLYVTLRELSAEQRSHIAENNGESLLTLLGRRQQVIDELARLDGTLAAFRRDWSARYGGLRVEDRGRVDALLAEIDAALTAIMEMDREDAEALARRTEGIGTTLREAPKRRAVHAAYAAPTTAESRYIDQKDEDE